ncbi:MAG: hypothetical protein EBS84_21805 [Proteobacteria bacterium]|nr:hypothetical protein [Pseudomonadota bacterium]
MQQHIFIRKYFLSSIPFMLLIRNIYRNAFVISLSIVQFYYLPIGQLLNLPGPKEIRLIHQVYIKVF